MHDWLYGYDFDEASGNFKVDNFGRGGDDGDPVNAEAQDGWDFGCVDDDADPPSTFAAATTPTSARPRTAIARGCRCTCSRARATGTGPTARWTAT